MKLQNLFQKLALSTVIALPITSLNVATALAGIQDFTVVNHNDLVIVNLYVSSAKSNSWGRDILGQQVIQSEQEFFVQFNNNSNQCWWDIKTVYEDGSYDVGQFNLCETSAIRFWGNGGEYR